MTEEHRRLREFVRESNRIEGIHRDPTSDELNAHAAFVTLRQVTIDDLVSFVRVVADASLRDKSGMNVRVGAHRPPPGGPDVRKSLERLLRVAHSHYKPYEIHRDYERLHPFTDGNGRSGRVLWAWHMRRGEIDPFSLPFLHRWYYQSLA